MPTWTGWPPRSKLSVLSRNRSLLLRRDQGHIDLADTIMLKWPRSQRTVEFRLSTQSKKWDRWDKNALALMEENIRYDLAHDGYGVIIKRISGEGKVCSTEMRWKLIVRPRC
jgi:hypothetical protein